MSRTLQKLAGGCIVTLICLLSLGAIAISRSHQHEVDPLTVSFNVRQPQQTQPSGQPSNGPSSQSPPTTNTNQTNNNDVVDVANLTIQTAAVVLAFVTLITIVGAFLGIREARNVRAARDEMRQSVDETKLLRDQLQEKVANIGKEFEQLVQAAHLFHEGQTAYSAGSFDQAIRYFEDALEYQPDNVRMLTRLGRCYTNKNFNARAEHYLRRALSANPDDADALRALATNRRYADLDSAIELAQKSVDLEPKNAENWNYVGLLLRDSGSFKESLNAHNEALRLIPTDPSTAFFVALLERRLGSHDAALHCLIEANSHVDFMVRTRRIKPLWANTVRWGLARIRTPDLHDVESVRLAELLAADANEDRTRAAVLGHMIFFLGDLTINDRQELHPCLSCFPRRLVDTCIARQGAR